MWKKITCFFPYNQVAPQPQEYTLKHHVPQLEATISSLKTTVEHKNALTAAQTRTISAQETTIELQNSVIARHNSDIARLENFIARERVNASFYVGECWEIKEAKRLLKM